MRIGSRLKFMFKNIYCSFHFEHIAFILQNKKTHNATGVTPICRTLLVYIETFLVHEILNMN